MEHLSNIEIIAVFFFALVVICYRNKGNPLVPLANMIIVSVMLVITIFPYWKIVDPHVDRHAGFAGWLILGTLLAMPIIKKLSNLSLKWHKKLTKEVDEIYG